MHPSRFILCNLTFFFLSLIGASAGVSKSGSLEGVLLDPQGLPIEGAKLKLEHQFKVEVRNTVSDLSGGFSFRPLEPALYQLTAEKEGFASSSVRIELPPNDGQSVELILVPSSRLQLQQRVTVLGDPASLATLPGSAHYLGKQDLAELKLDFDDIHQVLRQVPGVNITEEEGFGLRPNIGLRGTGSERSSKITLMEDGVLIAPAPYSSPSAYYFPSTGRMEALEVRKGSSQIRHGPQTQGGAINLISTAIPNNLRLNGSVGGGEFGTYKFHLNAGDSREHFGWLVETYQMASDGYKELDGGGDTGFDHRDYLVKLRFNSSSNARTYQELEFKLGYTDQETDETYVGLTDPDFRAYPNRRYRASSADHFVGQHKQYQARYFLAPSQRFDLTTTVYRNDFRRNWYKLQSVSGTGLSDIFSDPEENARQLSIIKGATSLPDELRVRANNRQYYSQGIQTAAGLQLSMGPVPNRLELGVRFHEDEEDRFQHEDGFQMLDGDLTLTSNGQPGSQSNRVSTGSAWAFFVQDTLDFGRLELTPGIRYENIELVRTDYSKDDPERTTPSKVRTNTLGTFIPGIGASFELRPRLQLFAGIHRGFSPPGPGSTEDTKPETGINYEMGLRLSKERLSLDLTTFLSDYTNMLGADTLSSGGSGEGDLYNGGKARVGGLELAAHSNLNHFIQTNFGIPVRLSYTYTDTEFRSSFESDFDPWGTVTAGDEIPYIPKHQFYAATGLEGHRWRTRMEAAYVSAMRTQAGQGDLIPSQATDSHLVVNLSGEYTIRKMQQDNRAISLFVSLRNLFDNRAIVARRPAGVRPGLPRTLMGGIRFSLGR